VYSFLGWVGFEDDDDEEDEGKSGGSALFLWTDLPLRVTFLSGLV
jgi:hypothetical protein